MTYIELYKKYRPNKWEEIIGQDTTVESLKTAIKESKIPTAYLFQGVAGSGKTSIAKLLAKSLNCEHLDENQNPCNECPTCKGIDSDSQIGFKYISGANAGSVDDIRRLMEEARIQAPLKKKVFIIDEYQNLSKEAQESMLIPIERTDQTTLFILCTTNPEKIRPAILSRCQIRNLNKVPTVDLAKHLLFITKQEGLSKKITKEDIIKSAESANGSVRTAISNLETIVNDGVLPTSYSTKLIEAVGKGDVVELYNISNELDKGSANIISTLEEIYKVFSLILRTKADKKSETLSIKEISELFEGNFVLRALTEIGNTLMTVNKGVDNKILLEITLTKLCLLKRKEQ